MNKCKSKHLNATAGLSIAAYLTCGAKRAIAVQLSWTKKEHVSGKVCHKCTNGCSLYATIKNASKKIIIQERLLPEFLFVSIVIHN